MSRGWERDRAAIHGFVERVAAEYGAASVMVDADLDGATGSRDVRIVLSGETAPEPADLVVAVDAPAGADSWREYLIARAGSARKALLVVADNSEKVGAGRGPATTELAAVLWSVGRVREHAYLGLPWLLGASRIVQAPTGMLVRRGARLHAFVVDTAPRTPQARRRLRTMHEAGEA